jgi:hypothetical protein
LVADKTDKEVGEDKNTNLPANCSSTYFEKLEYSQAESN